MILVFSVKESGKFQGFARVASESDKDHTQVRWVLPPGLSQRALSGIFKLDWINRYITSTFSSLHSTFKACSYFSVSCLKLHGLGWIIFQKRCVVCEVQSHVQFIQRQQAR